MELRARFYVVASCAFASSALFLVTLLWPTWIELAFRVDPDGGGGSVEKGLVIVAAALALLCALLSRLEWRRARRAVEGGGHG